MTMLLIKRIDNFVIYTIFAMIFVVKNQAITPGVTKVKVTETI